MRMRRKDPQPPSSIKRTGHLPSAKLAMMNTRVSRSGQRRRSTVASGQLWVTRRHFGQVKREMEDARKTEAAWKAKAQNKELGPTSARRREPSRRQWLPRQRPRPMAGYTCGAGKVCGRMANAYSKSACGHASWGAVTLPQAPVPPWFLDTPSCHSDRDTGRHPKPRCPVGNPAGVPPPVRWSAAP